MKIRNEYIPFKIIRGFVTCSLLFYFTSCYSLERVSKEEAITNHSVNEARSIHLLMQDYTEYYFEGHKYSIVNDTLYGVGVKTKLGMKEQFNGQVALNDVMEFKINQADFSVLGTVLTTTGIILAAAAVGFLAALLIAANK